MGSQCRAGERPLPAESEAVLPTDDHPLPEIGDVVDNTDERPCSSRVVANGNGTATNTDDAVAWLTRVMRCALHGQSGHDRES